MMLPFLSTMEEVMIYLWHDSFALTPHFADKAGGAGFAAEALAGDADAHAESGAGDGYV